MLARDHYASLGLSQRATDEEIEQAYRHLSRRYHPEVNLGDPRAAAVFARIQAAFDVLSDPERRERYDRGMVAEISPSDQVDLSVRVLSEDGEPTTWAQTLARLTEQARRFRSRRGDDIPATVDVPLSTVELGRRAAVQLRRRSRCDACRGVGRVQLQKARACAHCDGTGTESFVKGAVSIDAQCCECGGDGVLAGIPCEECSGSGLLARDERVVVRIPAGVGDGHELRVLGGGHAGPRGGPPGDLVVHVRVVAPPGFERSGPHLRTGASIPFTLAILGGRIEVSTPDGERVSVRVPPLTQNGDEFRLRERGLEMPDGRRGDMLVRVHIRMPEFLDEDDKHLVRQLAERSRVKRTAHPARAAEGDR